MKCNCPNQAPGKIIWAEDEAIARLHIGMLWRKIIDKNKITAQLVFAENGREALEMVQKLRNEIFALITDCDMPHITGVALLHKVHQLEWWQGKTAMFTGRYESAKAELEELGVPTNVFKKPIEICTTESVLRSVGLQIPQTAANLASLNL